MASLYVSTTGLLCMMCGPGTYKTNDCVINMTSATCAVCPTGTFQTTDNQAKYCAACLTVCVDRYQIVSAPCTKIANTKCRCKDGYYFKNLSVDGSEGHCLQNKTTIQSSKGRANSSCIILCINTPTWLWWNNKMTTDLNSLSKYTITVRWNIFFVPSIDKIIQSP